MAASTVDNPERERAIRLKIDKIAERTENTSLPRLEQYWQNQRPFGGEMSKLLVEKMTFSSLPDAREGGALALSAFLMNSSNRNDLKNAGSLGACLEILYRTDVQHMAHTPHISNLVRSLHTLMDNDKQMQERLFLHPYGISLLNNLCRYCRGKDQELAMEVLKNLSLLKGGPATLLQNDCLDMLMSPELLYHSKTVRHSAATLIHRLVEYSPKSLSVTKLANITLDSDGNRKIDGYTEIQLLHAFLCHVDDLTNEKKQLSEVFTLLSHLIDEIKSETFENLDHMQLIIRCLLVASVDEKQVDFMLSNGLCTAMQYLVRTDFLLFKKKAHEIKSDEQTTVSSIKARLFTLQKGNKSKIRNKEGIDRSIGTLMALSLVMPEQSAVKSRNFDINILATQCALLIYENIIDQNIELVNEIVSSGTIPALLIRVGKGQATNERFNKPFMRFLHSLMRKVMLCQSHKGEHLAMVSKARTWGVVLTKDRPFHPMGSILNLNTNLSTQKAYQRSSGVLGIRVISDTLELLGVTPLLFSNLNMIVGLDMSVTSDTINCLSFLSFPMIAKELCQPDNLCSLLHLYNTHRGECFFPSLSLLCDVSTQNFMFDT